MTNEELRKYITDSETFCYYPFLELSTNPSGHIKPCCYFGDVLYDGEKVISITQEYSLDQAWNSESMIDVRKSVMGGTKLKQCETCYRDGIASMRTRSIGEYIERDDITEVIQAAIQNDYVVTDGPRRLELKPSNLCNLKCVMCNKYDSSQIEKELKELAEVHGGISVNNGRFVSINLNKAGITELNPAFQNSETADWSDNNEVLKSFRAMVPMLETLSFAGGETTLIPFVYNSLKYCVDSGHSEKITVYMSSNFTNLNKNLLELMPHFKKFELIASIDGLELVNDYSRYPSKWDQVSGNYIRARDSLSGSKVKLLVNVTVSALTVMNLDKLLYWIDDTYEKNSYYDEWPYNINLLWGPQSQQINVLPLDKRQIAIERLEKYKEVSEVLKKFPAMTSKIDLVINELKTDRSQNHQTQLDYLKNRINVLDAHRGIHIDNYIPDLIGLF